MGGEQGEMGGHGEQAERVGERRGEEEDLLVVLALHGQKSRGTETYIDVELPVEAPVDVQTVLELSTSEQAFSKHRGQEDGQSIVVAKARHLDAHVYPAVLALSLAITAFLVAIGHGSILVLLAQHWALGRLFDLGLDAHKCFGAVLEGYAGTAVCAGEHIVLGAHGAEVARALGDIKTQRRGLAEGRAQEGQLGGREIDEGGLGRHGGRQWQRVRAMGVGKDRASCSAWSLNVNLNFCRSARPSVGLANQRAAAS